MIVRTVLPCLLLGPAILIGALSLALDRNQLDPAVIEGAIHNLGVWGPAVHVAPFALGTVPFVPGAGRPSRWRAVRAGLGNHSQSRWRYGGRHRGVPGCTLYGGGLGPAETRSEVGIKGVEAEGWRIVAFVRLVAILPFNLLNYALGLTRIRLVDYVLASFLCMLPGTLAYTVSAAPARRPCRAGSR